MTKELTLPRKWLQPRCTISPILDDTGQRLCYLLEDKVRPARLAHATAIPAGRYQIIRSHSKRLGFITPQIINVPRFEGVRLHPGNTKEDMAGCLLVGMGVMIEHCRVYLSKEAFRVLDVQIETWLSLGEVWVTVTNSPSTPEWSD